MQRLIQNRAKNLRKNMTEAEKKLWNKLRRRQMGGRKFRKQVPLGNYIVDFLCFEPKIIIELDGSQHASQVSYDEQRTKFLEMLGYKVLRFWNIEVLNEMDSVLQVIWNCVFPPSGLWPPSPCGGRGSNRKKPPGIILTTVLIYLQILTLLGLYALKDSLSESAISLHTWQNQHAHIIAEQTLQNAENKLLAHIPSCVIPITSPATLASQPISWWQSQTTCAGQFDDHDYFYVVEELGPDPCAQIAATETSTALYYRLTLFLIAHANIKTKVLLQSTLVIDDNAAGHCTNVTHGVVSGRQAWNELYFSPRRN